MTKTLNELPEALIEHLRQPNVVIVATLAEDGRPSLDLLSWVWPMDARTVRLVTTHDTSDDPFRVLAPRAKSARRLLAELRRRVTPGARQKGREGSSSMV